MTNGPAPTRSKDSLADVVEMLLDKGVVINADIAVSVGETELLGIHLRAAIASFETASKYGLKFPDGTDMERVEAASGRRKLDDGEGGKDEEDREDDEEATTPVVVDRPSEKGLTVETKTGEKSESSTPPDELDAMDKTQSPAEDESNAEEDEADDDEAKTSDDETEADEETEASDENGTGNSDEAESEDTDDDDD